MFCLLFSIKLINLCFSFRGLSIKDVRSQGGGEGLYVFTVRTDIFQTRGRRFFQMRTSALFGAKIIGFFEIYGVSTLRTDKEGGVEPVRTIFGQGWGSIFCNL